MSKSDDPVAQAGADQPEDGASAVAYLTESVLPALEQARAALAKDGVTATVETSWPDPADPAEPVVSFYCGDRGVARGPELASRDVVEFTVSGGLLAISTAAGGRQHVEKGREQQAIEEAVQRAVSAYYAELEDTVR